MCWVVLSALSLTANRITDRGAAALACALRNNATLQCLDLSGVLCHHSRLYLSHGYLTPAVPFPSKMISCRPTPNFWCSLFQTKLNLVPNQMVYLGVHICIRTTYIYICVKRAPSVCFLCNTAHSSFHLEDVCVVCTNSKFFVNFIFLFTPIAFIFAHIHNPLSVPFSPTSISYNYVICILWQIKG